MRNRPICCNQPMSPWDHLYAWVDTHDGVEVDGEDGNFLEYDPTGWTEVLWDTQETVGYGCRVCGRVVYLDDHEDLGKDYTISDMTALLLREAAVLLSEDGENAEYDRAIGELICSMTGQPMEHESVDATLRDLRAIHTRMKESAS